MKDRKLYIKVSKNMLNRSTILLIQLNDKELAVEGNDNLEFEINELGISKLLELAMSDEEYKKWIDEMPVRLEKMADEVVNNK